VEVGATNFMARMLGEGVRIEIKIRVPSYNKRDYGGNDEIVQSYYSDITDLGYLESLAIQEDTKKRGCVTVQINPISGIRMTAEMANTLFDALAKARYAGYHGL